MEQERNQECCNVEGKQSSWVPLTPAKLFEAMPQPDCAGRRYISHLHSQIDDGSQGFNAQTSLLRNRDVAPINRYHEENKQDIRICTSDLHQYEPAEAIIGSDSPAISTPSKKDNGKKRASSNIDLNKRSQKLRKKKKHRPKVVVEGKPKRTSSPKTPKSVTPRRATSERDTSTTKRKYTRKNKLSETNSVCKEAEKSCKKALNFGIENYSVAEIRNDTVQESLCTSNNNEEETTSTLEPKRDGLMIENRTGGTCDISNSENGISTDQSCPVGFEIKRSPNSLWVYKRLFKCLTSSRKLGPNFPKICKKRRINRSRKDTPSSPWWSVAIEEHGQHRNPLRNRKLSANLSLPIKAKARNSTIGGESFMFMMSLCNSLVKTKKKKRSNKSIGRQNLDSLIAVPKCNQSPPTPSKPAATVSTRVKRAPVVNKKRLPPPVNKLLTGKRQGLHAPKTCVDVIHPGKCVKRAKKRWTEKGMPLVNARSCYTFVKTKKKKRSNKCIRRQNLASLIAFSKCNQSPPTPLKQAAIVSTELLPPPLKPAPIVNIESPPTPLKSEAIVSAELLPPLRKPAPIMNIESPPTPLKSAVIASTELLSPPLKPAPIVNIESLPPQLKRAPIVSSTESLPPPVTPAPIVDKRSPPPPVNELINVIHPGERAKKVEKRWTELELPLVNVRSCYTNGEVSSIALVHQIISSQRQGGGISQGLNSHMEAIVPSNHKKRISKKQSKMRPSEGCSPPEVSSLALVHQTISSKRQGVGISQGLNSPMEAIVPSNHKKRISKKQSKMRPSEGCSPPESEDIFRTANLRDPLDFSKVIDSILKKLEGLHISNEDSRNGKIVPYEGPFDPKKKRKLSAKVNLDAETMRVWNLLMVKDGMEGVDNIEDEDKKKWWEDERNVFRGRVDSFIARMHLIQGDRRFSPWKGSVVDSVVGVFLTQNVSDHLSSSAFMSLAAKFPIQLTSSHEVSYEDRKLPNNQELIGLNMVVEEQGAGSKTEVACDEDSSTEKIDLTEKAEDLHEQLSSSGMDVKGEKPSSATRKKGEAEEKKETTVDWDILRKLYSDSQRQRSSDTMDSVDWEAVMHAQLDEVAETIRQRGQHFIIAGRIKDFLDRVDAHHASIDLEWLRNVPPDDAKDFLLSVCGLGLKSVECIRLLALQHMAFPVDTNVGRIAVRLGWVPLQPLPEELQIHLLNEYPLMDSIQKYLWPRLCKLDQRTLYELHYQMITFGKVFCTKRQPNCNPCPMRGECRHFASAFASAKLALPGSGEKSVVTSIVPVAAVRNTDLNVTPSTLSFIEAGPYSKSGYQTSNCEPIIEEPASPGPEYADLPDIEDFYNDDSEEIPTVKLNLEPFATNLLGYMENYSMPLQEGDFTKALVALNDEAASIPRPKLKSVSRLRTQHQAYELPDSHPLLIGLERRDPDDPCPYLLSIWTPGETANSLEPPKRTCASQESGALCNEQTCFPCNSIREQNSQTIRGTILIPCRTAMRGRFPLNGTYFQVNEVFSDHQSSLNPINVPTAWIWNLPRRTVYCGTSATTIFRGLSTEEIQHCFWRGYVCVRGFDRKTRAPRPMDKRLHASGMRKVKTEIDDS